MTFAHPILEPIREALVDAMAIPGSRQIIKKVRKEIVVYCSAMPNHPEAKAMSYHCQQSIAYIIN